MVDITRYILQVKEKDFQLMGGLLYTKYSFMVQLIYCLCFGLAGNCNYFSHLTYCIGIDCSHELPLPLSSNQSIDLHMCFYFWYLNGPLFTQRLLCFSIFVFMWNVSRLPSLFIFSHTLGSGKTTESTTFLVPHSHWRKI